MNNPARLIHRHLSQMLQLRGDQRSVREVLGRVFSLDQQDYVALRRGLIAVDELFQATEEIIRAIPRIDHRRFLRHFPAQRKGFATLHLDNNSKSGFSFISEAAVEAIDLCAARLSEEFPEAELTNEDLSQLAAKIEEIFNFVEAGNFEPELREVALDLLETLRRGVAEYRIRGVDGLKSALEESVGKLWMYYTRQAGHVPEEQFSRLWGLVVEIEAAISKVLTYGPYLTGSFQRMLGG